MEANPMKPLVENSETDGVVVGHDEKEEHEDKEEREKQSRSIVSVRLGEEGSRFSFAKVEVNELPSDSPALEMRSQEEADDKEDKEEKVDQSEEEAIGKEEEDESVAIASVPSTSLKMPDLGPTSLAVCIILCLR